MKFTDFGAFQNKIGKCYHVKKYPPYDFEVTIYIEEVFWIWICLGFWNTFYTLSDNEEKMKQKDENRNLSMLENILSWTNSCILFGGTQSLFWNFVKFSNFGKLFNSS